MTDISFIVPCYNEAEAIECFYSKITAVLKGELSKIDYELIFIDDGSTDNTLVKIKSLIQSNNKIRYISFSRNFGKEAAILAGLQNSANTYVCVLDADLQDPPSLIPEMYRILETKEYDCVCSRRKNRIGENKIRSWFAELFYVIMNRICSVRLAPGARDFLMMNRNVVEAILSTKEYIRFFKGMFIWVGFKKKWLDYENINRSIGASKWNFLSLTKYALVAISSFTIQPLTWPFFIGITSGLIGFISLYFHFLAGLLLILFALQMCFMGIFGYYIATIFLETKKRPIYIIKESNVKK